jgi:spermidine synthase
MLLHPRPQRALAVGCVADGSITAMLQHPLQRLRLAEEDPAVLELLPRWHGAELEAAMADPRVESGHTDVLRALPADGKWDLVVLLDGDPTTVRHNRTRTLHFFSRCRENMTMDGVLVVRTGVSDTYLGGAAGRLLDVLSATLRQVFPQVVAVPGEGVLLVAGREEAEITLDPDELELRWRRRGASDQLFPPEMLPMLVDPSRADQLNEFVRQARGPVNTASRPRAVLLAAGLSEARGRKSLLRAALRLEEMSPTPLAVVVGVISAALLLQTAFVRGVGISAAFVVGCSSLGWWLLLVAVWQATLGSVYAEVGALSAAFMAGLAGGAAVTRTWQRPERRLPQVLAAGAVLSLGIAVGLPWWLPRLAVPLLLVGGGFLTGVAFAGVAQLAGRGHTRRGSGIGFAADEAGAAVAALVVGLVAMTWAGISATAVGLAIIELAAVPAVIVAARRG